LDFTNKNLEFDDSSLVGDSSKGTKGGSSKGKLLCMEALHGATEQNSHVQGAGEPPKTWEQHLSSSILSSENLEGLTEVSTHGLQSLRKNHCAAAKKRAKKTKLAEAPTGDSGSSGSQPSRSSQPQNLQKPSTPRA
jgi:hypothetical protein